MREVMKYIVLLSVVFLLSACVSPYREVKPDEVLESRDLLMMVSDTNWQVDKEYASKEYNTKRHSLRLIDFNDGLIQFSIYTSNYRKGWQDELFKKDGRYIDSDVDDVKISEGGKETGVTYSKQDIAYVHGLKCTRGVFSRGFGGSYYSGGVKFYGMECGYYDTTESNNEGKRILNIDYRYTHNTKEPQEATRKEKKIKEAVKKAVSTLKIKNIDLPRMEKEGLIHYDKEFESTKW